MDKEPKQTKPTAEQILAYLEYAKAMQAKATSTLDYPTMEYWAQQIQLSNEQLQEYGGFSADDTPNNVIQFPIHRRT